MLSGYLLRKFRLNDTEFGEGTPYCKSEISVVSCIWEDVYGGVDGYAWFREEEE